MPVIRFVRTAPTAGGGVVPASGRVRFRPTRPRVVVGSPDVTVEPVPFDVVLLAGAADADLTPTGAGWAWRVDESVDGVKDKTYYVVVPDVPGPLDDADLIRVDPRTLTPTAAPEAAWWPVANATITAAQVVGDDLVLTRHDGATVVAGRVTPTPEILTAAVEATAKPSNLALDLDGVPFISPGSSTVHVYADTDGRPYFVS